jgi:hypothetical protein
MKKMIKQVIAVVKKKIELIEKTLNNMYFAFMTFQIDGKILLEIFGGAAYHDFKQNHPCLITSQPLIHVICIKVYAQKTLGSWVKFTILPSHFSLTTLKIIYLPPLCIILQAVHIKLSTINSNQPKLVDKEYLYHTHCFI